jgi:hypothetical protein
VSYGLTTCRHRPVVSSRGVCLPLRVLQQRRCRAYWVSVIPLRRCLNPHTEACSPNSTLRFLRRCPSCTVKYRNESSLRLWLPYRVLLVRHRGRSSSSTRSRPAAISRPFQGFFPYSVFPATGSYLTPAGSHLAGYVTSSGFLTLSTFCSPRSLPGLFHPGTALGVNPTRPLSFLGAVRLYEASQPSWG